MKWILLFLLTLSSLYGSTLEWNNVNWINGSTSQTITNVDNTNIDIEVIISGGTFLTDYPQVNNTLTGGQNPVNDSLMLLINENNAGEYVNININFSQPVNNISFNLYDVDTGPSTGFLQYTFQDDIILNTSPSEITTGITNINFENRILGFGESNSNSSDGNVILQYNSTLTNINFLYGSGPFTQTNPNQQAISISNLTFYPAIPEPSTYISGFMLLTILIYYKKFCNKKFDNLT